MSLGFVFSEVSYLLAFIKIDYVMDSLFGCFRFAKSCHQAQNLSL